MLNIPCSRLQLRKRNVLPKRYVEEYKHTVHTNNLLKSTIAEFEKLKQQSEQHTEK